MKQPTHQTSCPISRSGQPQLQLQGMYGQGEPQGGGERLYQTGHCCSKRSPEASGQTAITIDGRKH